MTLDGKRVLITGSARRIGQSIALAIARAGADVIVHYNTSHQEAKDTRGKIESLGRKAFLIQADLADPNQVESLVPRALEYGALFALVNNASIFEPLNWDSTTIHDWNRHLMINLTAPFMLSQAFARTLGTGVSGRIVNLLDWRAQRPGSDHFPYTISKSALAALTRSLAVALAPAVTVNGLALGAVLPPVEGTVPGRILDTIPAHRLADLNEVGQAVIFLLDGPSYVTGEILQLDGGRLLV